MNTHAVTFGASGVPDFEGFTLFELRGQPALGDIYSAGNYTEFLINGEPSSRPFVSGTMHHEIRHGVLGGFGRNPQAGSHSPVGPVSVDQETQAADSEALANGHPTPILQNGRTCCKRNPNLP